ncbi:aminotransferase family protein [Alteribacillus bidgolensis]|uniref:Putrescine aminotransferase n=1 Tax=Alteribacillus bidgolensis TaxID=930129 RepID=A0A1G8QUF4_9BACI|nr:aspartate aminotransferase family protein [Alteribacillus bidgolensis]SDJ08318.1 putrescine aminotransferase [Alteribacillus bidgolensis]
MAINVKNNQNLVDQLIEWDQKHFLHPTSSVRAHQQNGPEHIFMEGNGVRVKDIYGNEYIDGLSALWNVNLGYGRTDLGEAAKKQMETLPFSSSFNNYSNEQAIKLAHKISKLAPGDLNVSFFTSGGSESNESVFKIIRHYWKLKGQEKRTKIISLGRAYHGVTMGASSATGMDTFRTFSTAHSPDFIQAMPYLTDCEKGKKNDLNFEHSIRGIIEREGEDKIAAVILEPIQGAGGVNVPPGGYLQAVRDLCNEYGIFMIADEVICGFGRTGKMFGVENWNVVPDFMTVAKGITSGYIPLGAVIMKDSFRDELASLTDNILFHGFTYSGHPTSCAVALKTLEVLENENIISHVKDMEAVVLERFETLKNRHFNVTNDRCVGLLGAFDVLKDPSSNTRFAPEQNAAMVVARGCNKRGLIVRPVMYKGANSVVFAPPLVANKSDINEAMNIFSEALKEFEKKVK